MGRRSKGAGKYEGGRVGRRGRNRGGAGCPGAQVNQGGAQHLQTTLAMRCPFLLCLHVPWEETAQHLLPCCYLDELVQLGGIDARVLGYERLLLDHDGGPL